MPYVSKKAKKRLADMKTRHEIFMAELDDTICTLNDPDAPEAEILRRAEGLAVLRKDIKSYYAAAGSFVHPLVPASAAVFVLGFATCLLGAGVGIYPDAFVYTGLGTIVTGLNGIIVFSDDSTLADKAAQGSVHFLMKKCDEGIAALQKLSPALLDQAPAAKILVLEAQAGALKALAAAEQKANDIYAALGPQEYTTAEISAGLRELKPSFSRAGEEMKERTLPPNSAQAVIPAKKR